MEGSAGDGAVPVVPWRILRALLHDPSEWVQTQTWTAWSFLSWIGTHGWRAIRGLTDTDIRALWQGIQRMIDPSVLAHPSASWHTLPESVRRNLMRVLFLHASDAQRRWMWESFGALYQSVHTIPSDIVVSALHMYLPVWTVAEGRQAILDAIRSDRCHAVLSGMHTMLQGWMDDPDPVMTEDFLSTVIGIVTTIRSGRDHDRIGLISCLTMVRYAYQIDPVACYAIPDLVETMLAAATSDDGDVSHAALQTIAVLRPFAHPLVQSTMVTLVQLIDDPRSLHATILLMESLRYRRNLQAVRQVIDAAWQTLVDPQTSPTRRFGAETILRHVIGREETVPVIIQHLHRLITDHDTRQSIMPHLAYTPYADGLVETMVDLATAMLRYPSEHELAMVILSNAWNRLGKDGNRRIVDLVLGATQGQSVDPNGSTVAIAITAVGPGVYDPLLGPQIVAWMEWITTGGHSRGSQHLLVVIDRFYHAGQPIPSTVLPSVVAACRECPESVTPTVLEAIWNTDLFAATKVVEDLMTRPRVDYRDVLRSIGQGWGKGDDLLISNLIQVQMDQILGHPHRPPFASYEQIEAMTHAILDGVGVGNDHCIREVWKQMVTRCAPHHLVSVASALSQRPELWSRGHPSMIGTLIRDIPTHDAIDPYADITIRILHGLKHGWYAGGGVVILPILHAMVSDILTEPPDDSRTMKIATGIIQVLRCGWGAGHDTDIGSLLQTMMAWFDRTDDDWMITDRGIPVLLALTTGGGEPSYDDSVVTNPVWGGLARALTVARAIVREHAGMVLS
jgi:hypothetical protein